MDMLYWSDTPALIFTSAVISCSIAPMKDVFRWGRRLRAIAADVKISGGNLTNIVHTSPLIMSYMHECVHRLCAEERLEVSGFYTSPMQGHATNRELRTLDNTKSLWRKGFCYNILPPFSCR